LIIRFVENIGFKTITFFRSIYNALEFSLICLFSLFSFQHYNPQTLSTFVKQFYLITMASLPKFVFLAILLGSLLIGLVIVVAANYNLHLQIGSIIVTFVLNEFAPLFTLFFVYLRLVPLIRSHLKSFNIELLIPELLSGIMSTFVLSILFALIMLSSGLIVTSFVMGMDLYTYKNIIFDAIGVQNIFILVLKSLLFGFVAVAVLSYDAIKSIKTPLMVLLMNIFFIEMLLLALQTLLA